MTIPALASRITTVTVYHSHALVTRIAALDLDAQQAPAAVRFPGLPLSLDDSSVRVRIAGEHGASLPEAADVRVVLEVPEADPDLAPPRDEELLEARAALRRLEDRLSHNQEEAARLLELTPPPRPKGADGEPPPPAPAAARLALIELRHSAQERLAEARQELQLQLHEAKEQQRQLEDRQRRATTARQAREHELAKSILVRLRSPDDGTRPQRCQLVAEYLVPGVCWAPCYTIRLSPDYRSAELAVRAQVCQATGEDWNGVALTLSTAFPMRWSELPELHSLRIGRRQPALPRTGWRPPPSGAGTLLADFLRELAAAERALQQSAAAKPELPRAGFGGEAGAVMGSGVADRLEQMASPADQELEELLMDACPAEEPEAEPMMEADLVAPAPPAAALRIAAAAPAPLMFRKKAGARKERLPAPGAVAQDQVAGPQELAAPASLLRYSELRLAGPDDSNRGALRPLAPDDLAMEYLASLRIRVDFNVQLVVRAARQRAEAISRTTPPAGHVMPGLWEGFAHAYPAEQPVSVPSDAAFHGVPLQQRSTGSELRFVTVPRESLDAFRFVSFLNPLPAPLPAGPADIYVGADYLLSSLLHTVAPGATAELGLGVEEAIKVARNTRFKEQASGLLGGTLALEHGIDIEVTSHLPQPAAVEVRERLPITREGDDKVEVEVIEVEPPWQRFEQPRKAIEGAYHWRIDVPPGGSEQLQARYRVTISAKHELVGGNRREQ